MNTLYTRHVITQGVIILTTGLVDWISEWTNEWISQWMNEWMNQPTKQATKVVSEQAMKPIYQLIYPPTHISIHPSSIPSSIHPSMFEIHRLSLYDKCSWNVLQNICDRSTNRQIYHKTCNIRRTLGGNKIVDHSGVVGASPVGAAPTISSFST